MGVTESQVIGCTIFIITGIWGQDTWTIMPKDFLPEFILSTFNGSIITSLFKMPIGGLIAYYFGILVLSMTIFEIIRTIIKTRSIKSLKDLFSLFVLLANCAVWINFSFFTKNIGIILFSFGFLIACLVCKLIVASVTKVHLSIFRCI